MALAGKDKPMATPYATEEIRDAAKAVPGKAEQARSKPAFQRFARLGLLARALIYLLLAVMAGDIAVTDNSPAQPSSSGALTEIGRQTGGRVLLVVMAIGLAGYATWRVAQVLGRRGEGSATKDTLKRFGLACVALLYFGLCGRAISLAVDGLAGSGGGTSSNPQPFVAQVLRWPAGPLWVGLVGAGVAVGGAALAIWGAVHDYSKVLGTRDVTVLRWGRLTGIVGDATRGLLIILVSVYLLAAAFTDDPARAKSLGQALRSFDRTAAGPALLVAAAVGLASFAAYSVIEAMFRRL
jgi:hypothetical protein